MNRVEIDPHSGFCPGVIRAISTAEEFLKNSEKLFSLGDIVHNEAELERLSSLGLVPLDIDDLDEMNGTNGDTVLIRAHGQPPKTYDRLRQLGFEIIDCTCPVVLSIQKSIRNAKGRVLIFGKHGHPEVLGLRGQVEDALVFENIEQLESIIPELSGEVDVFSQTTMSPVEYERACEMLRAAVPGVRIHDTICAQVKHRHADLQAFAKAHDVIVFVSGKTSSNGKVLSGICREANLRTYHVQGVEDIQRAWFGQDDSVGVCGATSTPRWLLEKVALSIENFQ